MKKILIGVGCSHTQGSAFVKHHESMRKSSPRDIEFASKELEELYKDAPKLSTDWITKNLTWVGKLNKYLKYDDVLNFGTGGCGIAHNIRSIKNYIYNQKDLSNHLIIHQLPAFDRVEVNFTFEDVDGNNIKKVTNLKEAVFYILDKDNPGNKGSLKYSFGDKTIEDVKNFFNTFYDKDYCDLNFIYELYWLQELIEAKGGTYRVWSWLECTTERAWPRVNLTELNDYAKIMDSEYHKSDENLHSLPNIVDMLYKINFIKLDEMNLTGLRLADLGLVKEDYHLGEEANNMLAKNIYNNLKRYDLQEEYEKTLK